MKLLIRNLLVIIVLSLICQNIKACTCSNSTTLFYPGETFNQIEEYIRQNKLSDAINLYEMVIRKFDKRDDPEQIFYVVIAKIGLARIDYIKNEYEKAIQKCHLIIKQYEMNTTIWNGSPVGLNSVIACNVLMSQRYEKSGDKKNLLKTLNYLKDLAKSISSDSTNRYTENFKNSARISIPELEGKIKNLMKESD